MNREFATGAKYVRISRSRRKRLWRDRRNLQTRLRNIPLFSLNRDQIKGRIAALTEIINTKCEVVYE